MHIFNLTLIGESITFFILVWFTMKYIWPPVIKAINDRQKKIADGLEAAERGKANLEIAQQQSIKIIQEAKKSAGGILDQANQQAVTIVEHGKEKAKEEGGRLLLLARSDIESEKKSIKNELRKQTALLAVSTAEKILRSTINADIDRKLIDQMLSEEGND